MNQNNETIKETLEKINTQKLSLTIDDKEWKKIQIAITYKYNKTKKSDIQKIAKEMLMEKIDEVLKEMQNDFLKD